VLYAVFGSLWILGSDRLLLAFVRDPNLLTSIQTFKGWAFVLGSAVLLFWAVRREFVARLNQHERLVSVERELRVARRIQQSFLPMTFPPFPGETRFDIFARNLPAREVGGDFYDFFFVGPDRLGVVIGDVSGKGIPSAILMAATRTMIRVAAIQGLPPDRCLAYVNRLLCEEAPASMFVSAFYGLLDLRTGDFEFSNAGHEPPWILHAKSEVEPLEIDSAIVLGVIPEAGYRLGRTLVEPGTMLYFYTDGITEATDPEGSEFALKRMEKALAANGATTPEELTSELLASVESFCQGAPQSDDITVLVLRFLKPGSQVSVPRTVPTTVPRYDEPTDAGEPDIGPQI